MAGFVRQLSDQKVISWDPLFSRAQSQEFRGQSAYSLFQGVVILSEIYHSCPGYPLMG